MRPLNYLIWSGGVFVGLLALTTTFTIAVDPYRMYESPVLFGRTVLKPYIYEQSDLAKTYQLERVRPKTLLLGNSRVEIGFDPESPLWPADSHPIFNAAEAGKGLFTARRLLQESVALRPPATVIVGLDFPDFLQNPSPVDALLPLPKADERRLLVDRDGNPNPERAMQIWKDRLASTVSIDALLDSVATVLDQNPTTSTTMTPFGFNPLHEYNIYVKRAGYYQLFEQKNNIYRKQYQRSPHPDFDAPSHYASFRYMEDIIRTAARADSRLILFIPPYHADYLDILHMAGLWPSFEAWKRALVRVVEADEGTKRDSISLIDFSGYNDITTEPVLPPGDTHSQMRWYWESGHYKAALGDRVIARIFDRSAHFGRELNGTTIEAVLTSIRENRELYRATQSAGPIRKERTTPR